MSSEWKSYLLSDVAQIISGGTPKTSKKEYWGGTIPWLSVADFNHGERYVRIAEKSITELGLKNSPTKLLNSGDTIISARGTVGVVAQIGHPMTFNQSCYGLRAIENLVISDFLYYLVKNISGDLKQLATGGVFDTIIKETFTRIKVWLPSIEEQKAITVILSSLDDRIENLRETNATLESIAQALFKSWFVNFDPVRVKAEGCQPEGIDAETAALFPDRFEESELGLVPKGWSFSTVDQSYILIMGQSPPGETYNENGVGLPFYQGRTDFGFRFPSKRIYCCSPVRLAEKGDILVSVRAPVGDVNVALEKCCLGRGVAGVRHSDGYKSFALYSIQNLHSHFKLFESDGTVFGSINKKDFQGLPIIASSVPVMQAFDKLVAPLDGCIQINEEQIRILSKIRNSLLPKLISGNIRIRDTIHDTKNLVEIVT